MSVYPRECGGTRDMQDLDNDQDGLSPRVRGNRVRGGRVIAGPRSIPASAGEPWRYPCMGWRSNGLSPRVRGNLLLKEGVYPVERSIPASAGEPPSM